MQHTNKHFTEKKKRGRTTTDNDEIDNDEITNQVPQPMKDKDEVYQTLGKEGLYPASI